MLTTEHKPTANHKTKKTEAELSWEKYPASSPCCPLVRVPLLNLDLILTKEVFKGEVLLHPAPQAAGAFQIKGPSCL